MNASSGDKPPSSPEGIFVARQPAEWLTKENKKPSPSELITFRCPYTLRKSGNFRFQNQTWTVGDIVSIRESKSNRIFYAQIVELLENDLCEKRAKIIWLRPKAHVGITNGFNPNDFEHVFVDTRLQKMHCLTFVMKVPNHVEYKKHIGIDYLVNTNIISHMERYVESDEDDGPKSKSKVRRLLNK